MPTKMILGIVAAILVISAGCVMAYLTYVAQRSPSIIGNADDKSVGAIGDTRWFIEDIGGTDTAEPITRVSLLNHDKSKTYFSSAYSGICSVVDKSNLEVNQISGVACWWAGGGNKVGIFNENGTFVIKEGIMDEGSGGVTDDSIDKWVTSKEIAR